MKLLNTFILIICLVSNQFVFSQTEKLKEADKMFDRYAFIDAREIYLEVAKAGYQSENLFKKLGDSYYFNGELPKAEEWYGQLYTFKNGNLDEDYLFRYAMALKSNQKYKESDKIMLEFEEVSGEDSRVNLLKGERNYLELIEMQSGRFTVDQSKINSELSDFSPTVYQNKMVFATNRSTGSSVKRIHEWNKQPYLDLYEMNLDDEGNLKDDAEAFPKIINSKFHESSATFTKDGLTIYFTRNNYNNKEYGESEEGINYLKIYKSTRPSLKGEWSTPVELPFASDDYSIAHPALNTDETKLYFSSDMPGTKGLSDIFVVDIDENGAFGVPRNLGDKINTEGRENFPYVSDDNSLYFSSNGHIGLGGLDVFVTIIGEDGNYGEVFNLGRPINSSKDDFSFYINSKTRKGFFASNRDGGVGADDIYLTTQIEDIIKSCQQYIDGKVSAVDSEKNLEGVTVELFDEDLTKIDSMITDVDGKYKFTLDCEKKYIVRVSKDDYETTEERFQAGSEFEKNFQLPVKIEEGENLGIEKAGMGDDLSDLLQLDPIYFDLDKTNIRKDAEVELQKVLAVLKKYPSMKIDIRSHTDSRGSDSYNLSLSDRRAQSTVNYLVNNGISSARVTGKGYGETQLINNCDDGVDCTEEEHALNRRSEFIILNENQTPQEVRDAIAAQNGFTEQIDQSSINNTTYDFSPSNTQEVYTVQIAALSINKDVVNFRKLNNVFYHKYVNDGYTRYYTGQFTSREQAEAYKNKVLAKGFEGAFIVKLKGDKRLF